MAQRLGYLDSSRGLAAISVVFSHFFGAYGLFSFLEPYSNSTLHFIWHGEGAVAYFYVLSGFVLSLNFFKKDGDYVNFNVIDYIIRRVFRIFPIYLVSIWVSYLLLKVYLHQPDFVTYPAKSDWIRSLWNADVSFGEAVKQSLLIISIPESTVKLLPQGWTLQAELICSAMIPIAVLLFKKQKALFGLFFCYIYFEGNWNFLAFAMGIIIAYYSGFITEKFKTISFIFVILFLLLGLILYTSPYNFLKDIVDKYPGVRFKLQCAGSSIFLICLIGNRYLKAFLSKKPFEFLGKISYGIYVTHFFILIPVVPFILRFINEHNVLNNDFARGIALSCLLTLTVIISFLLNKVIEEPFIKSSKRISKYFFENNKAIVCQV